MNKQSTGRDEEQEDGIVISTRKGPRFISTKQIVSKMRDDFEDRHDIADSDDFDGDVLPSS